MCSTFYKFQKIYKKYVGHILLQCSNQFVMHVFVSNLFQMRTVFTMFHETEYSWLWGGGGA